MTTLELARLQFATTTLFHFIFVPMSIGLALFVAICQTRWYRTGDEVWLRATKFWGKFLLISMAIGVVTGIVQEFQFGMNWAQYSRYVGNIFGAPLAMEGLAAFFLESTFIGLWIFGWGRLSRRVHLLTIWLVAFGTALSAYFILAANSWMQHPVGYAIDHHTHQAVLTDIFSVLFNSTVLLAFPHTVLGAFATGGMLVVAVCGFMMLRGKANEVISRSLRMALPFVVITVLVTMLFGDGQGRLMEHQQPMKMAAAEAVCHTGGSATNGFSLFSIGTPSPCSSHGHISSVRIPHLLSLIEDFSWNSTIKGVDNIQHAEVAKYGPGNYIPIIGVEYWTFRWMIGAGTLMLLIALVGWWRGRRPGVLERSRWFQRFALLGVVLPIIANWSGWIFTEVGRQPWAVFGLLKTAQSNSQNVSSVYLVITLAGYILLYGTLIVVGGWLMLKEAKHGPDPDPGSEDDDTEHKHRPGGGNSDLILAY